MDDFKPNPLCKGKPHRRVEKIEKIPSDKLYVTLKGTCQKCGTVRIYKEEYKQEWGMPMISGNIIRNLIH